MTSPFARLSPSLFFACSLACQASDPDTAESEGSTETETETGEAIDLQLSVESSSHSYQCIDGCEGYYSDEWLSLSLLASPDSEPRMVELAWHDWTLNANAELSPSPDPLLESVELVPGELVEVEFHISADGFCNNEVSWSETMRVLIAVDGVELELSGNSVGSGGWDC